jgi:hypothetical protein
VSAPRTQGFRELDDLVLHLKGLVLVRAVRQEHGAEIDRVRDRLAAVVRETEQAA